MSGSRGAVLDAVFAMIGDAVIVVRDGKVDDVNVAFERESGWARSECIGLDASAVRVREPSGAMVRRDGGLLPVHIESREVDGCSVEVLREPSNQQARLQTEKAEKAESALRHASDSFRNLLHSLPDPIVVHRAGTLVFANPAVAQLLGYANENEMVGMNAIALVHPEDSAYVAVRLSTELRPNRTAEHRLVTRTGEPVAVETVSVPYPFDGEVARVVFIHDRREQRRLEAERALTERLASLGRLASAVGHEINNPLTFLLGALELLERDLGSAPEALLLARESAERVRSIVRDMRSLYADDGRALGVGGAATDGCDLRRAVDVAAATAAHEIRHRAKLTIDVPELHVAGTEGRLVQVFVNLLVNAAQAIDAGAASDNEICVRARAHDQTVVVEVTDTGCGVADAERIFEPFFTTKGQASGSGLGLAIVQRIVASLGGTVGAESRAPRGTTFRVVLPSFARPRETKSVPPPREMQRARVLIADDEPLIGRIAKQLLETHEVVAVDSGKSAIDLLRRGDRFDAIVCDLQMKELGGADVYEWVVASRPELEGRIGFMTGGAFTPRAQTFLDSTRRPCLEKPFDSRSLVDLVACLLGAG